MQVKLSALSISWTTAPYLFIVLYIIANVVVISNPHGVFTNLRGYLPLIWASSVGFLLFFIFCQNWLSPRLHPVYATLPWLGQKHWNMRLMSTLHAIMVSIGAAIALSIPGVRADMLETWHPVVGVTVSIFLGYCALDTYLTLAYHDQALGGGFAIILHHAMAMTVACYPLNSHYFAAISACYLLNELSTPFMNMIHFFRDLGLPKDSKLAFANSIVFMVVYFLCRVCVNTYVLIGLLKPESASWTYPPWLLLSGGAFVVAFLLLNLYWFYKILSHAVKLVLRPTKSADEYEVVVEEGVIEEVPESQQLHEDDLEAEYSLDHYEMA